MSKAPKATRLSFSLSREQTAEVAKILGHQTRFFPPYHPARTAYEMFAARLERTLPETPVSMDEALQSTQDTLQALQSAEAAP